MSKLLDGQSMVLGTCYYPEHWDESMWEKDLLRMLEVGIHVVRIAEFAWSKVEPREGEYSYEFYDSFLELASKVGMKVIFCTPTATPPAWLTDKYPEVLNATIEGTLYRHGARRHYNYNSPVYLEFCKNITEQFASHYAPHPSVIGWQIDNELNCEVDVFYSESDTIAFRRFLKKKYGTVERLNQAWGTVFWNQTYTSWGEVYVPRKTINNNAMNPHQALDYSRFVSDSACNFTLMQSEIIRKYIKEGDFITTNGIFSNLDNHRLTKESLDFMTYDSYPNFSYMIDSYNEKDTMKDRSWSGNLSEVRSISQPFGIMEQQTGANGWSSWMGAPTPRPGQLTLWTMQSIAHGADFISYFRWRTATVGTEIYWHGILDYSGRDNRRLEEVRQVHGKLDHLQEVAGSLYQAEVGLLKDYDNMWDARADVWHNRLDRQSQNALFEAHQLTHTPMDYVYMKQDLELTDLTRYKVLFYPHATILTSDRVNLLEEYVNQGGTLVMGCRTGYKDQNGKCVMDHLPGLATTINGTDVYEYSLVAPDDGPVYIDWEGTQMEASLFNDLLAPVGENAQVLGSYMNSYYKGTPGLIRNSFGKGYAYYFGGAFTTDTAKVFLQKLGVSNPYGDLVKLSESCEIAVRQKRNEKYIFILNYSSKAAQIQLLSDMMDMYTGEKVKGE
ncbi:MAG TPA: beta-galactosidase, partial [Lachnospiraceae bacterium]|nr:beta-galactosidase [Lachnospiraceae bacterium]